MPKDYGRRMTMDSRMVHQIGRDSRMASEQGSGWLSEYGGISGYIYWAKQPITQRLTYFAYQAGYTNTADIAAATDLTPGQVNAALSALETKGLVEPGVVAK